jgi:ribosomal protein S27E
MENLNEKVAYLKGFLKGSDLDLTTSEGKILKEIIEVLEDVAEEVENLKEEQAEIAEYVDILDEDLSELEEEFYGEDEEEAFLEMTCPNCGETIYLEPELFEEEEVSLTCPNCGEEIFLEEEEERDNLIDLAQGEDEEDED